MQATFGCKILDNSNIVMLHWRHIIVDMLILHVEAKLQMHNCHFRNIYCFFYYLRQDKK